MVLLRRRLLNGHAELLWSRLLDLHRLKSRLTANKLNNLPRGQPAKEISSSVGKRVLHNLVDGIQTKQEKYITKTSSILVAKQPETDS